MESDTDTSSSGSSGAGNLGMCEICQENEARYTCPRCDVRVCCLKCLLTHKEATGCVGSGEKEMRTKKWSKKELQADANFLEECRTFVQARKIERTKTDRKPWISKCLRKLRQAAHHRNTSIRFLFPESSRHRVNGRVFDTRTKVIMWRVEWVFVKAGRTVDTQRRVDEKCSENEKLSCLLEKYADLEPYQSQGLDGIEVLLKAEGIKNCRNRYFRMDINRSLKENLVGKMVVEFPVFHVVWRDCHRYDIIGSDEDVKIETHQFDDIQQDLQRLSIKHTPDFLRDEDCLWHNLPFSPSSSFEDSDCTRTECPPSKTDSTEVWKMKEHNNNEPERKNENERVTV